MSKITDGVRAKYGYLMKRYIMTLGYGKWLWMGSIGIWVFDRWQICLVLGTGGKRGRSSGVLLFGDFEDDGGKESTTSK